MNTIASAAHGVGADGERRGEEPDRREWDLVSALFARRRLLVPFLLAGVVLALVVSLLTPPRYTATVTVLPRQSPLSLPFLSGLAGWGLAESPGGESLESLYGRIVESDRVLDPLIATGWRRASSEAPQDLFTLLGVPRAGNGPAALRAAADLKRRLRGRVIDFSRDAQTGFMELRVTVPRHSWLAAALADSLAGGLTDFMRDYRAGKAQEQAQFIAARVVETESALRAADDALARFVLANRLYDQSVTLAQEHRRLQREVEALTSVWLELRRQLELARIESNDRKLPLDVLDAAREPVDRSWPRHTLSAVAGLLLGMAAWALLAVGLLLAKSVRAEARAALRP